MAVSIDHFPSHPSNGQTVSYTVAADGTPIVLIVPTGMTVTYRGKTYPEGTWTVPK